MTAKRDKYNREIRIVTISGKQYQILPEARKMTHHIRGFGGRFIGRATGVERSDQTQYIRILKPIDFNKDKIPDLKPGQIVGRISRYPTLRPKAGAPIQVRAHISNKAAIAAMHKTQKEKFRLIRQG